MTFNCKGNNFCICVTLNCYFLELHVNLDHVHGVSDRLWHNYVKNYALAHAHFVFSIFCGAFSRSSITRWKLMEIKNKLVHVLVWCLSKKQITYLYLKKMNSSWKWWRNVCDISFFVQYINFRYSFSRRLHMKFGFHWHAGLEENMSEIIIEFK